MALRFHCPRCQKKLKAHDDQVGAMVQCSGCGEKFPVPAAGDDAQHARHVAEHQVPRELKRPEEEEDPVNLRRGMTFDEELDMTPMIDMTFLLLVFFMVTASFSLQKAINTPPPDVQDAAAQARTVEELEEDDSVVVRIDRDNTIWIDDNVVPTRQELIAQLREKTGGGSEVSQDMLIMASGDARHETVVMVMDAGSAAKVASIRLSGLDDEDL
jgi:biopolymer transport protein ExbD